MRSAFRSAVLLFLFIAAGMTARAQGTWVQQPTALQSAPTTFVQVGGLWGVAMSDTGTGFAAGYASVANGFSGVLRKTAGNPTWFVLPSSSFASLPNSHSLWSAVTVVGTHVWVAGSNGRLYKSTDNGSNWAAANNGLGGNTLYDVFFKNQNEGMTVGSDGVFYYTSDGGANWVAQTLPATVSNTTPLYGVHSAGSNWYVSGGTNTLMRGTPASSSTSWVDLTANTPGIGGIEGLQFLDNATGTIGGITLTGSSVFRTTNSGASWTSIGGSLPAVNPYNGVFFFHPDSGWTGNSATNIYRTSNGGQNWTQTSTTALPSQTLGNWLTRLAFPSRHIGFASGGAPGTSSTGWILRWQAPSVPDISSTPDTLGFGTLDCDTTTTKIFTISNSGNAVLNISQISFSSNEFSIVGPPPTSVPIGGGATFVIRWTPAAPGAMPANAGMTITCDDPDDSPYFVSFSGQWNVGSFAIGDSYDFGITCIGDSLDINLIVTVTGNLSPQIIAFEHVSGPTFVRLVTPAVGSTISGSTPFTFRAKPVTGGALSSVYRLIYGNPLCPKQKLITFTTTVQNADLVLDPVVVDFGDVCVGEEKDLEVTVRNNGTTNGTISQRIFSTGRDAFPNQHFTPFGPVTPGSSMLYRVRFAPNSNDTGLIQAEYKLVVDPCRDTLLLTLKGRGVRPRISFTPTSVLGLGPVPTGQVTEENVFITNTGNTALNLSAITLNPPHPRLTLLNTPPLPSLLPPGQTVSVRVRFTPDRVEVINASLCVHWSSPCADSTCLPVAATSGDAPTIDVASSLDMGLQPCAAELRDTLWVRNLGGGTLTIKRFLLGGNDPGHFTVRAPGTPAQVMGFDSIAVVIGFLRSDNGTSTATLTIEHNDSKTGGSSAVSLRAERQSVEFEVMGDSTSAFVSCAGVGTNRSFQIRNRGVSPLEVRDITVIAGSAEFHVSSTPLPAMIPGGSGLPFEINFTPPQKGLFAGTVSITVGPCGDTYLVNVTGQGNITEVTFSPDPVDFGSVDVGDSNTRVVRFTNNGTTALSVNDIFLRPSSAEFSLEALPVLPVIVNAGAYREVTVRFSPQSVGNISTNLCVSVTAPCPDTVCVTVRGRGNSTGLAVSRTRIEYTLDPCAFTERCDSLEVVNSSGTTVRLTDVRVEPAGGFTVSLPGALPLALADGSSGTIRVCAQPGFTGTRTANLVIESDDATVPLIRVPLTARRDSSGLALSLPSIDFGTIAPCEAGISEFVYITNTGTLQEFLDTLERNEAFVVTTLLPVAMQPGAITQARVTFVPPRAGVFEDTLYFTTPRCGLRVPLVVRGEMVDDSYRVTPRPLVFSNVPVGSSQTLDLTFENQRFPSARIADVIIEPAGAFDSWGAYPKSVTAGQSVALPIQYNPPDAGPHAATACIIIDLPCPDTICVDLQGSTGDGGLAVRPSSLDFGVLPNCDDFVREDTMRNIGSGAVTLTATRIEGTHASFFDIENPVTAAEPLAAGAERVFRIRARSSLPPTDGDYGAQLVVETDNGAQPRVTVPLAMQRRTPDATVASVLDFGTIFTGTPETRGLVFTNNGSMDLTLTGINLPPGVTVAPPLPLTLAPGAQVTLDITLTPSAAGAMDETLELRTAAPCAVIRSVNLLATVVDAFAVTPFDFGQVPICRGMDRGSQALRNNTTKDASITAARLEGADASAFTLLDPSTFPVSLAAGGGLVVAIRVRPDASRPPRLYTAELVLTTDIDGSAREIRVPVSADARASELTVTETIDFGTVSIGTVAGPRTERFTNDLTYPLTVDSIHLQWTTYNSIRITGTTPTLPAVIPPGGALDVTLEFAPVDIPGESNYYQIFYSDPCDSTQLFAAVGWGIDDAVRATLRIGEHSGKVDDVIEVPLLLERDLGGTDVRSWEGTVAFDRTMLHPLSVTGTGTLSSGMTLTMDYDNAAGRLRLSATGGMLAAGTGAMAMLRFQVLVGAAAVTPLRIDPDFAFTTGRAKVESRIDGSFTLTDYCAADGIRYVNSAGGLQLMPNRPNPFGASTVIEYAIAEEGVADLRVYDRMGREVAVLVAGRQTAGRHRVTFDASRLRPGVYFAVLRAGTQSVTRKLLRIE